ncbi:MAG: TIGR02147 family protein [Chitinispirillaceae bacterium]|nr:TIGR02147 family protein [Chitinispirillaceae bacterium]
MAQASVSIFEFSDYHQFFKAFYQYSKATKRFFSYRYLAQRSGVAASLLIAVMRGERRITPTVAKKYAEGMELTARETEYLLAMVDFERARTHTRKNEAFSRMVRLRGQSKIRYLDADQYEYFSHWYHSAVREMISLPFFREDHAWIGATLHPPVRAKTVGRSLKLLERLHLLVRDEKGILRVTDKAVSSEYEIQTLALRNFTLEMIERARESLETVPVEKREVSGLTMGVSDECIERIKQRIRIFKEEIISMVVDDTNTSRNVYQMNFQFFPLIKPVDESETDYKDVF